MTTGYLLKQASELAKNNAKFKISGFKNTAPANQTSDIDYLFSGERWLTGGILLVKTGHWDDLILKLQVIDKDNVLGYGANTVLAENGENINIVEDSQHQLKFECSYLALIPSGVYFRVKYQNSHATEDTKIAVNLFTHIPKDI